nr:hypothetical protein [Tanacetum cinerariifolium]
MICVGYIDERFGTSQDPVETEALESPHTVSPPTSLPGSTPPTLVPILRTIRMVVCFSPLISLGLSASIVEMAAMSNLAFLKDDDEDEEEEDEEIKESSDSDSESEDAEDEGPTVKDGDPATKDEGLAAGDEGLCAVVR